MRQITVIMFTDLVGYTRLMGRDEKAALQALARNQRLHENLLEQFHGKLLKEVGDGMLLSFQSISEAVYFAGELVTRSRSEENLQYHIGIHIGEVVHRGNEIYGDGINIAARLQTVAKENEIVVSENIFHDIRNKEGVDAAYLGEFELKNVELPIKLYRLTVNWMPVEFKTPGRLEANNFSNNQYFKYILFVLILSLLTIPVLRTLPKLSDERKVLITPRQEIEDIYKSIAILPFSDLSPDGDQQYFADGIMEEILSHLHKIDHFRVPSRTTLMQYADNTGKPLSAIAEELDVDFILEGSVRKDGNNVRIKTQLIEVSSDSTLWSRTYNRVLEDIFQIQSDVAQTIAEKLSTEITPEIRREIESKPTSVSEAYDKYLQAHYIIHQFNIGVYPRAQELLLQALQLDPFFTEARSMYGFSLMVSGLIEGRESVMHQIESEFNQVLELIPDDPQTHLYLAVYYLWYHWDFAKAQQEWDLVSKTDFTNLSYLNGYTDFLLASGRFEEALGHIDYILERDKKNQISWRNKAFALCYAGALKEGVQTIETVIQIFQMRDIPATLLEAYLYAGEYARILHHVDVEKEIANIVSYRRLGIIGIALYHLHRGDELGKIINMMETKANEGGSGSPSFYLARIYAQMGNSKNALFWLNIGFQNHEVEMYWLMVDPMFAPLHNEPEWNRLLQNINFPEHRSE